MDVAEPTPEAEVILIFAQHAEHVEGPQSHAFDLVALEQCKSSVRPKFSFWRSGRGWGREFNLFDTLISNESACERFGMAFTRPVVIPAKSRFLLSDIKRLKPLYEGWPSSPSQGVPAFVPCSR